MSGSHHTGRTSSSGTSAGASPDNGTFSSSNGSNVKGTGFGMGFIKNTKHTEQIKQKAIKLYTETMEEQRSAIEKTSVARREKGTIVGNHLDFFRDLQRENYTTERGLLLEMDKLAEEKRVKLDALTKIEAKAKASEALRRVARERYERTLVDCFLRIEAERAKVESRADELVGLIKRRHAVGVSAAQRLFKNQELECLRGQGISVAGFEKRLAIGPAFKPAVNETSSSGLMVRGTSGTLGPWDANQPHATQDFQVRVYNIDPAVVSSSPEDKDAFCNWVYSIIKQQGHGRETVKFPTFSNESKWKETSQFFAHFTTQEAADDAVHMCNSNIFVHKGMSYRAEFKPSHGKGQIWSSGFRGHARSDTESVRSFR